ncbi:DUF3999 family protein, partial [Pseudomonas syringae]|uniref:DUF3999 family protein n=1 Tax=Pseudomonas syringae TaxID=317 RepID=UPI001F1E1B1C
MQVITGFDAEILEALALGAPVDNQLFQWRLDCAGVQQPAAPEQEPAPIEVNWFALYSTQEAGDTAPVIRIERSSNGSVIEVQPQSDIEAGEEVLRGWLLDTSAIKAPLEQLVIDWST